MSQTFTGFAPSSGTNITTNPLTNWVFTATGAGGQLFQGTNQATGTAGGWYANNNLSFLGSGSVSNGQATWSLQNNSGSAITGFSLDFLARMFKSGTNSPTVSVSYQGGACGSNPSAGALTNSLSSLTFSDATANISTGTTLTQSVSGINIPAGSCIYIRFVFSGGSSSDNLGIDNLNFTVTSCAVSSCTILSAGTLVGACNNAGTLGGNTSDDYYTFSLNPTGSSLGSSYSVSGAFVGSPVSGIVYGSATTIGGSQLISSGAFNITITDAANSTCVFVTTVTPPATCSADAPISPVTLLTQSINPCGGDGQNEFIVASTGSAGVNIADLAFTSDNLGDMNYFWGGSNVPANAYNISGLTGDPYEACGVGTVECYGFLYPSNSGNNVTITNRINQLNACAGCSVFLPVPSTNIIPAGSNFIVFLGAGFCDFHLACTNLNFSNHCSGGTATQTYYAVFGTGNSANQACNNTTGGFFGNSSPRTSTLLVYDGTGANTTISNYFSSSVNYSPGSSPAPGNGGFISPDGTWVNDQGCVPLAATLIFPLELIGFNVKVVSKNEAILTWQTANEVELDGFEIQRSYDGILFETIGFREARGIPLNKTNYVFSDKIPLKTIQYYRLKMKDLNGSFTYSPIKILSVNIGESVKIFPTLVDDKINLSFDQNTSNEVSILVIDIMGKIISRHEIPFDTRQAEIDAISLAKGMYFIQVQIGNKKQTFKIQKL
ncbi:MAG: T9SS type A sorting domain-containing protein [Saprospiraceae bacterium]|nr:T9SS type A sorting domain-containing protein [Saprospiraceae bacterium]